MNTGNAINKSNVAGVREARRLSPQFLRPRPPAHPVPIQSSATRVSRPMLSKIWYPPPGPLVHFRRPFPSQGNPVALQGLHMCILLAYLLHFVEFRGKKRCQECQQRTQDRRNRQRS